MEVTPEWIAVVLTLMGLSGGAGAWVQEQRHKARAAMPIIRADWRPPGKKGHAVSITIVNRLNEDLVVSHAECRSTFTLSEPGVYDPATGTSQKTYTQVASPMDPAWSIHANSEGKMTFRIDGAETPRWLRLTMTSSTGTLRRKRMVVQDRRMP